MQGKQPREGVRGRAFAQESVAPCLFGRRALLSMDMTLLPLDSLAARACLPVVSEWRIPANDRRPISLRCSATTPEDLPGSAQHTAEL